MVSESRDLHISKVSALAPMRREEIIHTFQLSSALTNEHTRTRDKITILYCLLSRNKKFTSSAFESKAWGFLVLFTWAKISIKNSFECNFEKGLKCKC